jgi:hypothetical protein
VREPALTPTPALGVRAGAKGQGAGDARCHLPRAPHPNVRTVRWVPDIAGMRPQQQRACVRGYRATLAKL